MKDGIGVIVLAAGSSRRMGEVNKLCLPIGGRSLLRASLTPYLALGLKVHLVVGHMADTVSSLVDHPQVRIIHNPLHATGMASSVSAGVAAIGRGVDGYLIGLGDMPSLRSGTVAAVLAAARHAGADVIVRPRHGDMDGHPVYFGSSFAEALTQLQGDQGARSLIRQQPQQLKRVAVDDPGIGADVDTPQAYQDMLSTSSQ